MIASRTSNGWRSSLICSTLLSFWFFLRLSTHGLPRNPVQAALGLLRPRPAPRPRLLLRGDRPRLRFAPYALVAPLQERVDGHTVLLDVPPHLLGTPTGQRRYLGGRVAPLPGEHPRARPLRRLLAPYPRHPRLVPLQSPLQRLYLPHLAAQLRRARPHPLPVTLYLLLHRQFGPEHL